MKKLIALLLALLVCISIAACSSEPESTEPTELSVEDQYAQLVAFAEEGKYLEGWRICQGNTQLTDHKDAKDYLAYCEAMRAYEAGGLGTALNTLRTIPHLLNAQATIDEILAEIGDLDGYYIADNGSGSYLHIVIRDGKIASDVIGYSDEQTFAYTDEDFRNELVKSSYTTGETFIGYGRYSSVGAKLTIDYVINVFDDTTDIMVIKYAEGKFDTMNGLYEKVADLDEN